MADLPDPAELEKLGLYNPASPGAEDHLRLLGYVFELGASIDETQRAHQLLGLGSLALDLSIRPPGEALEIDDFASESGLDGELVLRLWLALGLPRTRLIPLPVTPDAAVALRVFAGLAGLVGEETALALARVIGSSAARMAEALAGAMRVGVELPQLSRGTSYIDVVKEYSNAGRELLPLLLDAMSAIFRRHLVLVSYQVWSTDEDRAAVTLVRSVGFADLVGSTEAVRTGSVASLAYMVREFEELVWDLVTRAGGRVVKLIGDEAMFVLEDPKSACAVALELIERSPNPVRIGIAHGGVVGLFGDYYGETVNLAARLVAVAEASSVVVSEKVEQASGNMFRFVPLPQRQLKGFGAQLMTYRLVDSIRDETGE